MVEYEFELTKELGIQDERSTNVIEEFVQTKLEEAVNSTVGEETGTNDILPFDSRNDDLGPVMAAITLTDCPEVNSD
jgi:hypothetical protein